MLTAEVQKGMDDDDTIVFEEVSETPGFAVRAEFSCCRYTWSGRQEGHRRYSVRENEDVLV